MRKSKASILDLIVLLPFMVGLTVQAGCASGGMKKPTVFVDPYNNIPADIPLQFLNRYERFITGKEQKEFEKLQTDEERQVFIDKFWAERDPDPSTPGNEYKQKIDERIDDIANERFFGISSTAGLLFRSNGGFRGDLAKVYLLHGEPDAMDVLEGNSFVNLMLWVYINPENGKILYAFLFHQKGSLGAYSMFSQDFYQMDPCGAVYEVASNKMNNHFGGGTQDCPDDIYRVYNDISSSSGRGGALDGTIFAWALFNFSQDGSILQGTALSPPKSASETAKQSKARVTGEAHKLTGTVGTDYILASCKECNSLMPADLTMGERFIISGPWKNFDWVVKGEYVELSLKYRIVFQDHNAGKPMVLEGTSVTKAKKSSFDKYPELIVRVVDISGFLDSEQFAAAPPGIYQVNVYVKNTMTNKYNAWFEEISR